jgi:hypothetical protein
MKHDDMRPAVRAQVVTANRVRDGVPVYFTGEGWSPRVADAAHAPTGDALLEKARAPLEVIEPYAIDVAIDGDAIRPLGLREEIRAFGPTA